MPRGLCGGPLYVGCKEAEWRNGGIGDVCEVEAGVDQGSTRTYLD